MGCAAAVIDQEICGPLQHMSVGAMGDRNIRLGIGFLGLMTTRLKRQGGHRRLPTFDQADEIA